MDAKTPSLYLAGVFSGSDAAHMVGNVISHRAAVPNPLNVGPEGDYKGNAGGTLDVQRAVYVRRSRLPGQGTAWQCHNYGYGEDSAWCQTAGVQAGVEYKFVGGHVDVCGGCRCCRRLVQAQPEVLLEQRFYAHRTRPSLLIMEYEAAWEGGPDSVVVSFDLPKIDRASFHDFSAKVSTQPLRIGGVRHTILIWTGSTIGAEHGADRVEVSVAALAPSVAQIPRGRWLAMAAAFCTSLDTSAPGSTALSDLRGALTDLAADQERGDRVNGTVFSAHTAAWAELWRSGISVTGRPDVEKAVQSSAYYILSSLREDRHYSLSPGSLASNGYNGHTFWDTETWMYPPLLMWYPELARSILQYRVDRLPASQAKAQSYNPPYSGVMFAWESAFTGLETCPPQFPTGLLEQHISADIAFAVRQYFFTTSDVAWLKKDGFGLLSKVANFFVNKAVPDEVVAGRYHINKVIPPDEYATQGVDDCIYTNWVAKLALEFATEAAEIVGGAQNPKWTEVAQGLVLLFDEKKQAHPEYAGYRWGRIKQADVVLLPYPLGMPMTKEVRLNDLERYAKVTDRGGPAMTWGMHAIGYIEAGEGYEAQAASNFNRSFANVKQPFLVWTETPAGGTTNFITGAGGFLQAATFGYLGLRIRREGLELAPSMIEGATSMEHRGLRYRGRMFAVLCDRASATQALTLQTGKPLAVIAAGGPEQVLRPGGRLSFPLGSKLRLRAAGAAPARDFEYAQV